MNNKEKIVLEEIKKLIEKAEEKREYCITEFSKQARVLIEATLERNYLNRNIDIPLYKENFEDPIVFESVYNYIIEENKDRELENLLNNIPWGQIDLEVLAKEAGLKSLVLVIPAKDCIVLKIELF